MTSAAPVPSVDGRLTLEPDALVPVRVDGGAGAVDVDGDVRITARGRAAMGTAAPGHVATVRRIFIDRLTPSQLDAIGEVAAVVLAGSGEPVEHSVTPSARQGR